MNLITGRCTKVDGAKRLCLPGITVKSTCPNCGLLYEKDLSTDYLSYGDPTIYFYCEGCEHEWQVECNLTIKLTVKDQDANEVAVLDSDEPITVGTDDAVLVLYGDGGIEARVPVAEDEENIPVEDGPWRMFILLYLLGNEANWSQAMQFALAGIEEGES